MRIVLAVVLLVLPGWAAAQSVEADEDHLRRLHHQLLQAHLEGDVEAWMAIEADSGYVSVNGGYVRFPSAAARREGRAAYLREATFSVYRDLREPLVRLSTDGTLGWLIVEVEVQGTLPDSTGAPAPFHDVWAWVELYQKTEAGWRLVGNASNKR